MAHDEGGRLYGSETVVDVQPGPTSPPDLSESFQARSGENVGDRDALLAAVGFRDVVLTPAGERAAIPGQDGLGDFPEGFGANVTLRSYTVEGVKP